MKVATPRTEDSFFVKVIGRGYPPPTNKFRWCTDRLRIRPVQRMITNLSEEGSVVVLLADGGWKYLSTGIYDRDLDELQDELERSLLW